MNNREFIERDAPFPWEFWLPLMLGIGIPAFFIIMHSIGVFR